MTDPCTRRRDRRELVERLALEYAGAVPPGQVLAAVVRADRLVGAYDEEHSRDRLSLCEAIARRSLAERAARRPAPMLAGAAVTG